MTDAPTKRLACTRCGSIIPTQRDTRVARGEIVKDCPRCRYAVNIEEAV